MHSRILGVLMVLAVCLGLALPSCGMAFTYQGKLTAADMPATGTYDLQFTLFGAPEGGVALDGPVTVADVAVTDGLFTVALIFNPVVFTGATRWLAIEVRPGESTGDYTLLTPRQQITATPYALTALNLALPLETVGTVESGAGLGVRNLATNGTGILGEVTDGSGASTYGAGAGVSGFSNVGAGVNGITYAVGPNVAGVVGSSTNNTGVLGSSLNGIAGKFSTQAATANALEATTSGGGCAIYGWSNSGTAGKFVISNEENAEKALSVVHAGTGPGAKIEITNPASSQIGLWVQTAGTGSGGDFRITNAASTGRALRSSTVGGGYAFQAESNTNTAIYATSTSGKGLYAQGSDGGVFGTTTAVWEGMTNSGVGGYSLTGYGVSGRADTGKAVYGRSNTGISGEFAITNNASTATALHVATAGLGQGALIESTNASNEQTALYVSHTGTGNLAHAAQFTAVGGRGLYAASTGNHGVYSSGGTDKVGVYGVRGSSGAFYYANAGVFGYSETGLGTGGGSTSGIGGRFSTSSSTNPALQVTNTSSGDIIQGYAAASSLRFRVTNAGNVQADGTFSSPAADFAELLPGAAGLEPGDVLVIGADGQLTRCTQAFQPTVAGVYSTKPAFQGGMTADITGKVPLAVVGVVPVKVTATNGAIKPGDLLVASATPGHAMKAGANPAVGVVIGKALTGLDTGTGVITMLVVSH